MKTPLIVPRRTVLVTMAVLLVVTTASLAVPTALGQEKKSTKIHNSVSTLYVTDFDADNAPDVLVASPRKSEVVWYQNGKPRGTFKNRNVITDKVRLTQSVFGGDLDQDGDHDVVTASSLDNKVAWHSNTDGYGTFADQEALTEEAGSPYSAYVGNFDGDDDADVLFASNENGQIGWIENKGESFSGKNIVSSEAPGAQSVYAADLDRDGDQDALSASSSFGGTNKIAWYRYTGGGFASLNIISKKHKGAKAVVAADLTGNGDNDVLAASSDDGKIAWYENSSGYGSFSGQNLITSNADGAQTVSAADIDDDGDLDVLSASNKNGKIAWYDNLDGGKGFSSAKVITDAENYSAAHVADIDVDGDPDVVFISESKSRIGWCSNQIDQGKGFTSPQIIGP